MNKVFTFCAALILGAAGGYLVGYKVSKKKYEDLADREVESVKKKLEEHYKNNKEESSKKPSTKDINVAEKPKTNVLGLTETKESKSSAKKSDGRKSVRETLDEKTYKDYSKQYRTDSVVENKVDKEERASSLKKSKEPYAVSPGDYNCSSYATKTYKYYTADQVVADEDDCVVRDYADHVGNDALSHIGEYESDCVYIRNDAEQTDYEIIQINGSYYKSNPTKNFVIGEDDDDFEEDTRY